MDDDGVSSDGAAATLYRFGTDKTKGERDGGRNVQERGSLLNKARVLCALHGALHGNKRSGGLKNKWQVVVSNSLC